MIKKTVILATAGALTALAALIPAISPALAAGQDGAALFRQRCSSCHTVAPTGRAVLGPNLAGVVGRKSAATAFNYSPAMKNAKVTWNRANLDRFLTAPARMVPGTRMVIAVSDPQQRAAILDYLTRP